MGHFKSNLGDVYIGQFENNQFYGEVNILDIIITYIRANYLIEMDLSITDLFLMVRNMVTVLFYIIMETSMKEISAMMMKKEKVNLPTQMEE